MKLASLIYLMRNESCVCIHKRRLQI